jgi:hypothetical protein
MATTSTHRILNLQPAQALKVKVLPGQHYTVRKAGATANSTELQIPDNVIATRQGDALHLRYSDGGTVSLDDFFVAYKDASACSVNLVGDNAAGVTLSADTAASGLTTNDGSMLVYAHGSNDVLTSMAEGDTGLLTAFGALGEAPVLMYLTPATPIFAASVVPLMGLAQLTDSTWTHSGAPAHSIGKTASTVRGVIEAGPVIAGNDLEVSVYAANTPPLASQVSVE